jgi:hypothetical protein
VIDELAEGRRRFPTDKVCMRLSVRKGAAGGAARDSDSPRISIVTQVSKLVASHNLLLGV